MKKIKYFISILLISFISLVLNFTNSYASTSIDYDDVEIDSDFDILYSYEGNPTYI